MRAIGYQFGFRFHKTNFNSIRKCHIYNMTKFCEFTSSAFEIDYRLDIFNFIVLEMVSRAKHNITFHIFHDILVRSNRLSTSKVCNWNLTI